MYESNVRTVRGLSIAAIILSALAVVGLGLGALSVGVFGSFASDPGLYQDGIVIDGYDHGYSSFDAEATADIVGFSLAIAMGFLVWGLLCSVVSLIAGIIGLRNSSKPEKLGSAFGWSIAGAVAAFLCGRIITTVLLVAAAVYLNKLRNPATPAATYQPQPSPYGQPYPGPQQPYGEQAYPQQPQQSAAPEAPSAPATPDQR